ncbi:mannonate dehydratase [Salinimicrobium sp. MT39]|uniref:Mannonate dehydratase n=1 Tax=Salinimicrobium profundisediminis TaxID=2994553 RepID=A0A9X3CWJ6_9FLAO|nr:mannonate dehydratase [Salinimicrobium profundisediminis]MCX2838247.1 mannonate dehydratase [Salinimicrobium profundisediminis]
MEKIFEQSWRWYGPNDPVSLKDIKQAGASGVVTALHHIPVGEVWSIEEIEKRKSLLEESNRKNPFSLRWNVVESLPVHEHIKQGKNDKTKYIENYKQSLINLGKSGVTRVCYNFMPVLDWLRTNVRYQLEDGSTALLHDLKDLIIFDLFILKRERAEEDYDREMVKRAKSRFPQMPQEEIERLRESLLMALPGDQKGFTLEKLQQGLEDYKNISAEQLRENLVDFLKEVIPVAEEAGVKLAIHPDDPPWPVLGLPRVVSNKDDLDYIFSKVPQKSNGLTFCSGSFGASEKNDLPGIIKTYFDRIHFVHLRSVQREARSRFYEANHLEGSAEMYKLVRTFYECQKGQKTQPIPMRPDHGHQMLDDLEKTTYPGYSAIGRLRGLAELRGLEMGIVKSFENE